jgi:hypothetical protein
MIEEMKTDRPECDIQKTQIMAELLSVSPDIRDETWNQKFLITVQTASFASTDPQVIKGPDSFPYFGLHIPEPGKPFTSYCIRNMKDDFLLVNGYGVSINPVGNAADWVFSYGDIVNLQVNNEFYSPSVNVDIKSEVTLDKDENILVAQPSASYLPQKARNVIKNYLQYFGIPDPKVMLISRKIDGVMVQQLSFNIFKEDVGHPENLDSFMRQLSWFLPRQYIVVMLAKNAALTKHYEPL